MREQSVKKERESPAESNERDFFSDIKALYRIILTFTDRKSTRLNSSVAAEDAEKALALLGEAIESVTSDWKLRYQMNLDLLKKGSIFDIVSIVRTLYHRSKVKELPILERKLYDNAKKLLEDEIAFALGKPSKEVEAMLHAKLEPLGALIPKKQVITDDDEDDDDEFSDEINDSDNDNDDDDDSDDSDSGSDSADGDDDMDDDE